MAVTVAATGAGEVIVVVAARGATGAGKVVAAVVAASMVVTAEMEAQPRFAFNERLVHIIG